MPLDTGNVRHLHLVTDSDADEAPVAVYQPSLDEGSDIGMALKAAREFRDLLAIQPKHALGKQGLDATGANR